MGSPINFFTLNPYIHCNYWCRGFYYYRKERAKKHNLLRKLR
nr:MAG TPA: hypothetical protein [Caudoviricetes sp.]